ncbi:hypothetical protein [Aestuariivirga sp.]|uniref:hypothetical protein n=1 Tax=Aestuariivirga sp. TaxID=2650926 RepID=UPI00391BE6EA
MSGSEPDHRLKPDNATAVNVYCMGALVADEASRNGFRDLSRAIEAALHGFLSGLSRDEQGQALRLSYELALRGEDPSPPRLRLVYSRD